MLRATIIALVLAVPTVAEAKSDCRLVIETYPKIQLSLVSKQCWTTPDKTITETLLMEPAAEPAPSPPERPKCRMKGRIWHEGKCWLPERIPNGN